MKACTIIIPIYNAYECTKACIESVLKNTDVNKNRLVLINDKSTDTRIASLLENYSNTATIIHNAENLGFVKTVNLGMKLDQNDVLLLNSDTEVTPNWLEKIKHCAYQDDFIATVTPLSNNATLASVPKPFVPSVLPEGISLNTMAKYVEECSYHDYPELPTGHGFCLFIKRKVLDIVGYFDEETFGKGYGEESDFCYRCFNYGYRHVLCDDTYIYHKESQSFTNSRIERIEKAGKIIEKRYPNYLARLQNWCQRKPHQYIGDNIGLFIGAKEKRINILYIIHDWDSSNIGGTTLHAMDLVQNLRKYYNFHIFSKNKTGYVVYSYYEQTETKVQFYDIEEFKDLHYYNTEYLNLLEKIIQLFHISILHIHHLMYHYFNVISLIKKYKLYTIVSLHDYYSVCPQITKLYKNQTYCGLSVAEEQCKECLQYLFQNHIDIKSWRNEWHKLLKTANKIIVPSEDTKKGVLAYYHDITIDVIEHGIQLPKQESNLQIQKGKPFSVAFIGSIGLHKGSKILENFITRHDWKNIKIHLFGILDGPCYKNTKYYINHGSYQREELPTLLHENGIQLICLLSKVPETFSYTLSESIACGIPVLAFNMGAIKDRVEKDHNGWLLNPSASADEIAQKVHSIATHPEEYDRVVEQINKIKLKTVDEMGKEYSQIYQCNGVKTTIEIDEVKKLLKEGYQYREYSICDSSSWVFDTLKWKIISKMKVPLPIKKMYKKIRKRGNL